MSLSTSLLLALLCAALLSTVSAHRSVDSHPITIHSLRSKRQSSSSSSICSNFDCAVQGGQCGVVNGKINLCQFGQYCDGSTCQDVIPAGKQCTTTSAFENPCGPGAICTEGLCVLTRAANATFGAAGASCTDDNGCGAFLTCLNNVCTTPYTQAKGQSCTSTDNCAPGLYCSTTTGQCTAVSNAGRTRTQCDMNANACGANMECTCDGYQSGSPATCSAIQGTFPNMPSILTTAQTCINKFSCGTDLGNSNTITCIQNNCASDFCTYFTRVVPELFQDYPTCMQANMVGNTQYQLVKTCAPFAPKIDAVQTGAASALSASLAVLLISLALLFAF